jgi:hypothetical protein
MELIMKLTVPVKFGEEEITELKFKKPSGRQIRETGFPFSLEAEGAMAMKAALYISLCASIPMSVVEKLDPVDLVAASGEVCSFFGTREQDSSSTARSNS